MGVYREAKINQLLQLAQKGGLFFSSWLHDQGYSPQLLMRYRKSGWLSALSKGVFYRKGESLSALGALASYQSQVSSDLYVAAHSALELWGFNHYVPMGKPVLMVGMRQRSVPLWLKSSLFDRDFRPFHSSILQSVRLASFQYQDWLLQVSIPEQAFIECLYLAPKLYNYVDLFYIMEQLTVLRADVLQLLLEEVKHYRVRRLFLYMAEKAGHAWFDDLDVSRIDIGSHKHQLVKDGAYVAKYKMTIPKELYNYE